MKQQTWSGFGTVINGIAIDIQVPQDPTLLNKNRQIDVAKATISLVDGETIVKDLPMPVGDLSNALVLCYQHVVLGRPILCNLSRYGVATQLSGAMKQVNHKGGSAVIADTRDHGEFMLAGNKVTFQRLACGPIVETSFNTETLAAKDGQLKQGTWTVLRCDVNDVVSAEEQYTKYMEAYMGEGGK